MFSQVKKVKKYLQFDKLMICFKNHKHPTNTPRVHSPNPLFHEGCMRLFKNGCNGGEWEIFTRNEGEARNGGFSFIMRRWKISKVSLHS